MEKKFVLGIDLGTSNSAVTLCNLESGESRTVDVTQILAPNQIGERSSLPSALYLPNGDEFSVEAIKLPWDEGGSRVVGIFAREHGAQVPDRLVTSAKSWLSNPHVDPQSAVLPWNSEIESGKLSAVEASRLYLEHIKQGVLYAARMEGREWNLDEAQIVLTVPASFDEVARKLTSDAALAAGLPEPVLLEEPQAAFYAWTDRVGSEWRKQVQAGDVILVCDVGGGTADFSLIAVSEQDGNLAVERISVGEHILLGGDNMDLALAYTLQAQLEDEGTEIDDWQFLALIHTASQAKAKLFEDAGLSELPIAIPSRGSSLFAGTVSTVLARETLEGVVIDGFFALTGADEMPEEEGGAALQEFGLPYASDAVVSKHLARFLARSLQNVKTSESLSALIGDQASALEGSLLKPTAVLFNGGVFKADAIRARVLELLASWCGDAPRELEGFQPDLAVSKGAASYGRNRVTGQGIRIRAGSARSYYLGLESSRPAVPGFKPPIKAVCVVPQGMEEGSSHLLEGRSFGLVTGKRAVFRFFASEIRSGDKPGDLVNKADKVLEETSKLEITLPPMDEFPEGQPIPVVLNSVVTELGNLELWMQHVDSEQKWKVEFQVRME
ncbi:Hsp70 family protein [Pelagicoccus mobilis]|uniref:Hsp70 family protein n=1 Tax=Pelagicoccus mobilis TaxID=415221 RepID=A0A934RWL3_9BACT|nr:Hsp70 family protein [Pelagicoccus mobilis]MBK1877841.1 Hsp70 family protein [Pelagicoccus mobilis]